MDFEAHREKLFLTAYRMTGSVSDAEDLVQDTYLRISRTDPAAIESQEAYLMTVLTRLCIDQQRRAQTIRRAYAGKWLPEPLPTADLATPERRAEARDTLSMAFMILLERLTPTQRAVYVLREAFDYSYREIEALVGKSDAACRQIFTRARAALGEPGHQADSGVTVQRALLQQLVESCETGNLPALEALLTADITLTSDGGRDVKTAPRPIFTPGTVARFLLGVTGKLEGALSPVLIEANGTPALLFHQGGRAICLAGIELRGTQISAIRLHLNRDKISAAARATPAALQGSPGLH